MISRAQTTTKAFVRSDTAAGQHRILDVHDDQERAASGLIHPTSTRPAAAFALPAFAEGWSFEDPDLGLGRVIVAERSSASIECDGGEVSVYALAEQWIRVNPATGDSQVPGQVEFYLDAPVIQLDIDARGSKCRRRTLTIEQARRFIGLPGESADVQAAAITVVHELVPYFNAPYGAHAITD